MSSQTHSAESSAPKWRQVVTKAEGNKRVFKVVDVDEWAIDQGQATPIAPDGFETVTIMSPLCEDSWPFALHELEVDERFLS